MLTVIVCLVSSGKRSTRSPFPRRYSVSPSTEVTRTGLAGDGAACGAGAGEAGETRFERWHLVPFVNQARGDDPARLLRAKVYIAAEGRSCRRQHENPPFPPTIPAIRNPGGSRIR